MGDQLGVRHHDVAFIYGDMSPYYKAVSCHRTPKLLIFDKSLNSGVIFCFIRFAVVIFVLFHFFNVVTTAETDVFIVRSHSYLKPEDYQLLLQKLKDEGYHPFVREEKTGDEKFFYLELGTFAEVKTALPLVMELRSKGYAFFIYTATGEAQGGEAILSPLAAEKIFPAAGANADHLGMLTDIARGRAPAAPVEVAIKSRMPARITPPVAPGAAVKSVLPSAESPVRERLREFAWDMRENGYSVYVEGESIVFPEGILLGMFDNREDADDLADEIGSYGYKVHIVTETDDGERYFVYVEQESSQPQLSEGAGEKEGAAPTEGDALDYLLKKMRKY
ncbi:MAG: hypothetical protein AB1546_00170 [bacterium]